MLRTLTAKVTTSALVLLALVIAAATIVLLTIARSSEATHHLADELKRVDASHELVIFLSKAIAEVEMYSVVGDDSHRRQAVEALDNAQVSLNSIRSIVAEGDSASHERTESERLFQQRVMVFVDIQTAVNAAIRGVEVNNPAQIARNLALLELAEREVEALEEHADQIINNDVAADIALIDRFFTSSFYAVLVAGTVLSATMLAAVWLLRRSIVYPIKTLAMAAGHVAAGDLDQTIAVASKDEVGELQVAFGAMVTSLREQRSALEAQNNALEERFAAERQLFATIQQLSTPLLPVLDGVVVLPVVGHVDTQRADEIMQTLLQGVAAQRSQVAILDVTGIATLDTHVVKLLLQAIQATQLLGATVVLAGISAAMAQVIAEQGVDLGRLQIARDLRSAVEDIVASRQLTAA